MQVGERAAFGVGDRAGDSRGADSSENFGDKRVVGMRRSHEIEHCRAQGRGGCVGAGETAGFSMMIERGEGREECGRLTFGEETQSQLLLA